MKTLTRLIALSGAAMALGATSGFAAGGVHCQDVGGGVLTNFLDSTHTEGTSTGDIRGAVGVAILGVTPGPNGTNVYHVQHHWVTDSGDTIFLKDALLTAFPTSDPNRILGDYLDGVEFIGGTGRFDGATGKAFVFGAADLKLGQITLRYAGTVCFPTAKEP
jgi:hypothetical protein